MGNNKRNYNNNVGNFVDEIVNSDNTCQIEDFDILI